ncbi:MAG TPA: RagB/SusD family nutrient uptake outer membrane protein [Parasegetibacter sp.]
MKSTISKFSFSLILLAGFGCKTFLSEEPVKQTSIKTVEQLQALVDNAGVAAHYQETNYTAGYSTDDTEITREEYAPNSARFNVTYLNFYVWKVDEIVAAASDALWTAEWRKILVANTILDNLDNVTGSAEEKALVKADAHFRRAYSHWVLANYYCQPYSEANLNSMGLPIKRSSSAEESLERGTLKEVYDFILEDLNEAMKVTRTDVNMLYPWRVTKKTVDAMLSRYYLFTGDYQKALDHANSALGSTTVKLMDYKTIVAGAPINYTNPAATVEVPEQYSWAASQFLFWPEFYYPVFTYIATQWYVPSANLRSLYEGQNDLRYKWWFVENGGRRFSVVTPEMFRYTIFNDGRFLPSGLTRAEMLLNKAEALARLNKPAEAMQAVNELRAQRFTTPTNLTAANKDEAITKVLQERRREMPFAFRWLDIRRFSVNDYPGDDVTITREFYKIENNVVDLNTPMTYTLPVGSKRYAVPINGVDIGASNGAIQQNQYD